MRNLKLKAVPSPKASALPVSARHKQIRPASKCGFTPLQPRSRFSAVAALPARLAGTRLLVPCGTLPCSRFQHARNTSHVVYAETNTAKPEALPTAVYFEVDGAVIDVMMDGHRMAFNRAYAEYGVDCCQWTVPVFNDLLQKGDGSLQSIVNIYWNSVGWPMMLPTNERDMFVNKIVSAQQKALVKLLNTDQVPLRTDVAAVIRSALASGAVVVFLAGTMSHPEEDVAGSALRLLGEESGKQVKVFASPTLLASRTHPLEPGPLHLQLHTELHDEAPCPCDCTPTWSDDDDGAEPCAEEPECPPCIPHDAREDEQSGRGREDREAGMAQHNPGGEQGTDTFQSALRESISALKQAEAQRFVEQYAALTGKSGMAGLSIDPQLLNAGQAPRVTREWLAAISAAVDVPLSRSLLVGANYSTVEAAAGAGMTTVAVPRKMSLQGSFPQAKAKYGGYGPGELTWPRLLLLLH